MNDLEKIKLMLQRNKTLLRKEFKVKKLGIFGSFVRGEQRKNSDLDILVEFNQTPSFFEFLKFEERLSDLLKRKVDLVMKGSLKPTIGKHIMQEVVYV